MSALTVTLVDHLEALEALGPEWDELAEVGGGGGLFRSRTWLLPWYKAYQKTLGASLYVLAVRSGRDLVGLAPFYERSAKVAPGVKSREIRLMGDAGPRPPALDLLVQPEYEENFGSTLAEWFTSQASPPWDVMDLMPLRKVSRARAYLAEGMSSAGRVVESHEASSSLTVALSSAAIESGLLAEDPPGLRVIGGGSPCSTHELNVGLATLRRLSRQEWADREEMSPHVDAEAMALLREVVTTLGPKGKARLSQLQDEDGEIRASAMVVDDDLRAVGIALALDPNDSSAASRLLAVEARAAASRGLEALDVVLSAGEWQPPPLPVALKKTLRVRAFNNTASGAVARTYTKLKRRAEAALDVPGAAAAGARSAWTKIREAANQVAVYERLHLYRGELWTRGIKAPGGLKVQELSHEDFDVLSEEERENLVSRLELDEGYCREKWARGDLALCATLHDNAVGIAWCARSSVYVPEIGRAVSPGTYECYIHDVFVSPDARGRNVAPVMLEELARTLRGRDVYRAWALISPDNVASSRAFEKAAYAAVADLVYAKMSVVDKIVLRPADVGGKRLLGIK